MKRTKEELKEFFENGDKPTQEQFWDWQDSYWHKDEKIRIPRSLIFTDENAARNAGLQAGEIYATYDGIVRYVTYETTK